MGHLRHHGGVGPLQRAVEQNLLPRPRLRSEDLGTAGGSTCCSFSINLPWNYLIGLDSSLPKQAPRGWPTGRADNAAVGGFQRTQGHWGPAPGGDAERSPSFLPGRGAGRLPCLPHLCAGPLHPWEECPCPHTLPAPSQVASGVQGEGTRFREAGRAAFKTNTSTSRGDFSLKINLSLKTAS